MDLTHLVSEWIKDHPRFRDHYFVTGNDIAGVKLDWIRCKCKKDDEYPPLPNNDILVAYGEVILCGYDRKQNMWTETTLTPFDRELFTKIEFALDHSHPLPAY